VARTGLTMLMAGAMDPLSITGGRAGAVEEAGPIRVEATAIAEVFRDLGGGTAGATAAEDRMAMTGQAVEDEAEVADKAAGLV
jgi:hypothetical protein